ncbi:MULTISPECIES: hypothetical protein [unclassified Mucilaginibacter]|uniref:hypothetical protein n=1 Tax=unclassified Mucilaginibacter TaxID=2617802 RepID=UPI0031F624BD
MKKIFVIAALLVSTGVISSCTKESDVAPASLNKKVATEETLDSETNVDGKLGVGDGGVDYPPTKKPR